jgi:uncharacterized membrane-anchored protein
MGNHLLIAAMLAVAAVSHADEATTAQDQAAARAEQAWAIASQAMQSGPQTVALADQATLALPESYGFVPRDAALPLMASWGNDVDDRFIGLVFPLSDESWFMTVDYDPSGYIEDEEAKDWDASAMLDGLREGTEAGNAHRIELGIPPFEVTGWIEPPDYDEPSHRLVWSAGTRLKNVEDDDPGVNYNTYVLGREGFVSMNLVTSAADVERHKPAAHELLNAVSFHEGKRYEDFDASTDSVAAYGIAALVGGVAAKKLGFFALAAAFFAKFAKVIVLAGAALIALIGRLLRRNRTP